MRNLLKIWVCAFAFIMLLPFSSNAAGKKAEGYNIILPENIEHGKIESNKLTAQKKETVILTITSDNGYEFNGLSITSGSEEVKYIEIIKNEQYSFVMPKNDVNVFVGFKKIIIPVQSISMDSDLKLEIGETKQLFATIKPENATDPKITWTSDNEKVATVDNGLVTGISIGSATIRVNCNGRRANCNVNVTIKMAKPTDTVQYLPAGTDGSIGTEGTYVLFGDWPQTIKADDIVINENIKEIHGDFTYYAGSDGNWYVKCKPLFITSVDVKQQIHFSNGTVVANYAKNTITDLYFKVEPIKWRILNPNATENEKKILLAEKIILGGTVIRGHRGPGDGFVYNGIKITSSNYIFSEIRAYLNGKKNQFLIDGGIFYNYHEKPRLGDWTNKGFYNTAFDSFGQNKIADTIIEYNEASENPDDNPTCYSLDYESRKRCGHFDYNQATTDKIFLLSTQEITRKEYGFNTDPTHEDPAKKREITDYSKANFCNNSLWYLRSTIKNCCNSYYGQITYTDIFDEPQRGGYVPALTLE